MSSADDHMVSEGAKAPKHKTEKIYGRNRPTMGWRRYIATLMIKLGRPNWAPQPSRAEQDKLRLFALKKKAWRLMDEVKSLVIVVFNFKGGSGKTPIAAYLSCMLAELVKVPVAFVDGNPGSAPPGYRMAAWGGKEPQPWVRNDVPIIGMDRQTATVLDLYNDLEKKVVTDGHTLQYAMRQNHDGVATLVADPDVRGMTDDQKLKLMQRVLGFVRDHYRVVIVDTGNDFTTDTQKDLAHMGTDLVFPAYVPMKDAITDLTTTLNELSITNKEKVANGIIVFSGLNKWKFDDSLKRKNRRRPWELASDYEARLGRRRVASYWGVPYDPAIENESSVRLDLIRDDTYEALLNVLIAILERNVAANKNETSQLPQDAATDENAVTSVEDKLSPQPQPYREPTEEEALMRSFS